MTVAFNPSTIAGTIADVSISGITVLDIDTIPESGSLLCPVLFPQPEAWLSDVAQGDKGVSVADATQSDFTYVLHYVFLLCEAGSGIESTDPYNDLVSKLQTIIQTLLDNDTLAASIEISLNGVEGIGIVQDPSEVDYWGALLSFKCLEYA